MYPDPNMWRSLMKLDIHHANEYYFGTYLVQRKSKMRGGYKRKSKRRL